MALYFYRALSKEGKKVSGYLDASSIANAKDQLTGQGLYPIDIISATEKVTTSWWRSLFVRGMKVKEKILFTRQLSILLHAGVPLLQALELLVDQFKGTNRSMLVAIKDDVKQGTSFANALKKYPKTFDAIYVQLVRAGEASGHLEVILDRLTDYLQKREETRKRIRSAMTQPIIQLGFAVVVIFALLYFVVPSMAQTFLEMDIELPTITRIAMGISAAVTGYWWLLFLIVFFLAGIYTYWRSTAAGAYAIDRIKLRLPIFGYFVRMNAVVQFSYTLGLLLESGVNLAESLDIVVNIINNQVLAETLRAARDKIIKQGKISQYLKQTNIFPPIAIYLINTGEQTGQLDKMLLTIAQTYEKELAEWSDSLTALLSPVMLVIMAIIVGFIVMAVFSPMLSMVEVINIE